MLYFNKQNKKTQKNTKTKQQNKNQDQKLKSTKIGIQRMLFKPEYIDWFKKYA